MTRNWLTGVGFVACVVLISGCDAASTAAKKAGEGAKDAAGKVKEVAKEGAAKVKEVAKEGAAKAKEVAKEVKEEAGEVMDKAKVAIIKPIEDALPKLEEKMKGLSGDAATKAKEKFEAFKKMLEEFKTAAPDKWQSLKEGLMKAFEDLKKMIGLEK
jgi:hypothetical protein